MPVQGNKILPMRDQLSAAAAELQAWSKAETPRHSKSSLRACITPLGEHGQPDASYPIEVKNVDQQGITFYHRLPLDSRRAMLVVESPRMGRLAAEVDLTWCQFNKTDRYTSGGRFVRPVRKTA